MRLQLLKKIASLKPSFLPQNSLVLRDGKKTDGRTDAYRGPQTPLFNVFTLAPTTSYSVLNNTTLHREQLYRLTTILDWTYNWYRWCCRVPKTTTGFKNYTVKICVCFLIFLILYHTIVCAGLLFFVWHCC